MKILNTVLGALLLLVTASCGGAPEVPQGHTYQVNLENGESYSGTIPNEELIAQYIDIPGGSGYRMITFNIVDGDFEMLVQVMMQGTTVLPIRDPESEEADGSFVMITPPGADIFTRYASSSGSMSASGLKYKETPGIVGGGATTGLVMGEFSFNCVFKRALNFDESGEEVSGTGQVSIKNYF